MEKATVPSASLSCVTRVQDHEVPEPLICSLLVAAAPLIVTAQVGVPMVSELVIEMVTVSPSSVLVVESPFPAMETAESVGTVSSWVTPLPEVTAVTAVPALPFASVNPMEKVTAPSSSASAVTTVHCQLFPLPGLVIDSALVASSPSISMSQVGVPIASDEVNARVIVSPSLVRVVTALLEDIVTEVSVGAVMSAVHV